MALVRASQSFVIEGYSELEKKSHLFARGRCVREQIKLFTWVDCICDESEVVEVIEEKIKEEMKNKSGWGKNFEGWTSCRKYFKPGEHEDYPEGRECQLNIEYIRNWKMEKIIQNLDAVQFATLCKEVGMNITEKIKM